MPLSRRVISRIGPPSDLADCGLLCSKPFRRDVSLLDSKYGQQIKDRDQRENVVANILAGHEPENDITKLLMNMIFWQTECLCLRSGRRHGRHCPVEEVTERRNDEDTYGMIAVRFFLNPDQWRPRPRTIRTIRPSIRLA